MAFTSVYPPVHSADYVKANSYSTTYYPYQATNPAEPLTGASSGNEWQVYTTGLQKFCLAIPSSVIKRIYLENSHNSGATTVYGVKNFEIYGATSSTAFTNYTTYSDLTDCTLLGSFEAAAHASSDASDPQYFDLSSNNTAYQWYIIRVIDNWGGVRIGFAG